MENEFQQRNPGEENFNFEDGEKFTLEELKQQLKDAENESKMLMDGVHTGSIETSRLRLEEAQERIRALTKGITEMEKDIINYEDTVH